MTPMSAVTAPMTAAKAVNILNAARRLLQGTGGIPRIQSRSYGSASGAGISQRAGPVDRDGIWARSREGAERER